MEDKRYANGIEVIAELRVRTKSLAMKSYYEHRLDVLTTCAIFDKWLEELELSGFDQKQCEDQGPVAECPVSQCGCRLACVAMNRGRFDAV